MHKLLQYVDSELMDIERKVERNDTLTMTEIQYADTLLRMKKNIQKTEEYSESYSGGYMGRGRDAKRDSRGRYADGYSRDMVDTIRDMMHDAPDEQTRIEFQKFIDKLDRR